MGMTHLWLVGDMAGAKVLGQHRQTDRLAGESLLQKSVQRWLPTPALMHRSLRRQLASESSSDTAAIPSTDLQEAAAPSEGQLLLQLHEAFQPPQAPPQEVGGVVEAPWWLQWRPDTRRVGRIARLPCFWLLLHNRKTPCQRGRLQQLS